MNAKELLRELKSKLESQAQIDESPTAVTEIQGNADFSKITVETNVEGRQRKIEVYARISDGLV